MYCLVIACNKPTIALVDTASLNLSFRATYKSEPLILNQTYDYEGNNVKFSNINFYLANLVAVNDDGETELSEIQFINLSLAHNTLADAEKGFLMNFSKIPVGTYKYLKFGVGVPPDLNRTTPADYATNHPLGINNGAQYSEEFDGYIFAKIEGAYDKDGDGFGSNDISFAYQIGGRDNLYKTIESDNILNLEAGETTILDFELDVRRLLTRPAGSLIRIIDYDPNDQNEERQIIMNNFERALQLK
ncbi:MAG: MbnP family protein [Saprospiraceae bacterium]